MVYSFGVFNILFILWNHFKEDRHHYYIVPHHVTTNGSLARQHFHEIVKNDILHLHAASSYPNPPQHSTALPENESRDGISKMWFFSPLDEIRTGQNQSACVRANCPQYAFVRTNAPRDIFAATLHTMGLSSGVCIIIEWSARQYIINIYGRLKTAATAVATWKSATQWCAAKLGTVRIQQLATRRKWETPQLCLWSRS